MNANDSHPESAPESPPAVPPAADSDAHSFSTTSAAHSPDPATPSESAGAEHHPHGDYTLAPAQTDGDAAASDPAARLADLAERAVSTRLRQSEEEEAVRILISLLTSGGASLTPALAALPMLNWNVGATAVTAAWAEMSATAQETFIAGLKREEQRTEAARRIRLSLARGLFKQDVEVAAKIIGAVCAEMKKAAGEEPITKSERRNFDAVMIGNGRPWICQLPLAEWRPAESAAVIQVAIASCFAGGNVPPFTQLSLLKWIADADRLDKIPDDSLELVVAGVQRWSPKWKAALKKEIAILPPGIASLVADVESAPGRTSDDAAGPRPARESRGEASHDVDDSYGTAEDEDAKEERAERAAAEADSEDDDKDDDADEDDEDTDEDEAAPADSDAPTTSTSPERRMTRRERGRLRRLGKNVSRAAQGETNGATSEPAGDETPPERAGARMERSFDLRETLRTIERHCAQLKTELEVARSNLRQRDDGFSKSSRGRRGRTAEPAEAPMPDSEVSALRKHNIRLEETVAELRARVDELTGAAEDEATSRDAFSDGPAPGERTQFQTLLGIKLAQAKSDFEAMQGRERDDVFDENYKTLLARVFALLTEHGITFPHVARPDEHMQSM